MNGRQRIVNALNLEQVDRTPVWFMRQAGRHLPEYRALAKEADFWQRCMETDLTVEITTQPLERYPQLDAAIIFSDILTPLPALGYDVEYGGGIRISEFNFEDVDDWTNYSSRKHAPWAGDALKALEEKTNHEVAHLGFCGAPWTVGMYLLAGGTGDREFHNARAQVHAEPEMAANLFSKLGEITGDLLADQVLYGGADAVQIFDTWAGLLSPKDYARFALPAAQKTVEVFREKCPDTPLIHYAKGSGHLHHLIRGLDLQAVSLDWRDSLSENRQNFGEQLAFQGNLDPCLMHGSTQAAQQAARDVLAAAGDAPGHIFNLGHGFAPQAKIDCVKAVLSVIDGE